MNKKFLSAILFGALMVTSTGTFVSCKDYDDDIDEINSKIDKIETTLSELESKIGDKGVTSVTFDEKTGVLTVVDGTNTTYLSNVVNHYFKCNYKHLLNKYRILHAKHLIDHNECAITELDKRCGFTSRSVFYDAFGKIMGIPPAHYRKRREKAAETCSGFSGTMENSLGKNEIHQQQVI